MQVVLVVILYLLNYDYDAENARRFLLTMLIKSCGTAKWLVVVSGAPFTRLKNLLRGGGGCQDVSILNFFLFLRDYMADLVYSSNFFWNSRIDKNCGDFCLARSISTFWRACCLSNTIVHWVMYSSTLAGQSLVGSYHRISAGKTYLFMLFYSNWRWSRTVLTTCFH